MHAFACGVGGVAGFIGCVGGGEGGGEKATESREATPCQVTPPLEGGGVWVRGNCRRFSNVGRGFIQSKRSGESSDAPLWSIVPNQLSLFLPPPLPRCAVGVKRGSAMPS
jgi:hypothetical protein